MGEAGDETEVEDREGGGEGRHEAVDIEMVMVGREVVWPKTSFCQLVYVSVCLLSFTYSLFPYVPITSLL